MSLAAQSAATPRSITMPSPKYAGIVLAGISAVFFGQLLTGTGITFATLSMVFHLFAVLTIWLVGGFRTILGWSVGYLTLQNFSFAMVLKIIQGDPCDTALLRPTETGIVYVVGMAGLFFSALVFQLFRGERIRPILRPIEDAPTLLILGFITLAISLIQTFVLGQFGQAESGAVAVGGFLGPLKQLNFATNVSVCALTAYELVSSGGKRMFGVVNAVPVVMTVLVGIVGAARQQAVLSIFLMVVTAIAFGFKFRPKHYLLGLVIALAFQYILTPYALYARNHGKVRQGSLPERIEKAFTLLGKVVFDRREFEGDVERKKGAPLKYELRRIVYHENSNPTIERYSLIPWNDAVIDGAMTRGHTGWETVTWGLKMLPPNFLYPEKPVLGSSNWIAQRTNRLMDPSDRLTGISMVFFADAFLAFGYLGVLGISFTLGLLIQLALAVSMQTSLARNIFALSFLQQAMHLISESTIQVLVLFIFQAIPFYTFIILLSVILSNTINRRVITRSLRPESSLSSA